MKIYTVGGAVRDGLLGLAVQDRDYVVVGATIEQMLAAGYTAVGVDFPVFLHPETHEEYALARTERKTAPGYKGFVFHTATNISLEQDLQRRDLTINAMARDEAGHLIDPYSGEADLHHKLLRHVSDAFGEDPVRILRVARFAARFATLGFTVAPETMSLMQRMVREGEADHLVAERVWQELSRGLMEATPARMFTVLQESGALARLMPELAGDEQKIEWTLAQLQTAAAHNLPLPVRFAVLTASIGKSVNGNVAPATTSAAQPMKPHHQMINTHPLEVLCERLRVPGDCRDLAVLAAKWHCDVGDALRLDARQLLSLFDHTDALRRPARFVQLLDVCWCLNLSGPPVDQMSKRPPDVSGPSRLQPDLQQQYYLRQKYLKDAMTRLQALDQGSVAKYAMANNEKQSATAGNTVANAIHQAKLDLLESFISEQRNPT